MSRTRGAVKRVGFARLVGRGTARLGIGILVLLELYGVITGGGPAEGVVAVTVRVLSAILLLVTVGLVLHRRHGSQR